MKYIVTRDDSGQELIFTFPMRIDHDAFAEALESFRSQTHGKWERIHRWPISAGFVVGGKCHGRSETLGLDSRPVIDDSLLRNQ